MPHLHLPGVRIFHLDEPSRGDGPPLPPAVLVHGWLDSSDTWIHLIPQLRRSRRVVALDLRGHGSSSAPDSRYDAAELAGDPAVIEACIELATQAPTGRNCQRWSFVVVTEPDRKAALADIWRRGTAVGSAPLPEEDIGRAYATPGSMEKVYADVDHLYRNLHRVPALVVPCITGRTENAPVVEQAGTWGSILPATWSFMLAAHLHGLGTCWTTSHLHHEREAAQLLGIDSERVMQVALTPLAYTIGTGFRPGPRVPVGEIVHWERW